jgi:hypothetical protein
MVRAARAARAGGQPASQQCGGGSCSAECRDVTRWHLWACSPPTCPRGGLSDARHRPAADAVLNAQPSSRWKLRGEQQRHLSAAPCSQASGMQSYTVVCEPRPNSQQKSAGAISKILGLGLETLACEIFGSRAGAGWRAAARARARP